MEAEIRGAKTKVNDEKSRMESSRKAEMRAAELRPTLRMGAIDKLWVDPNTIPHGWEYKWIRIGILGQPDYENEGKNMQLGYTPVPADRHPELVMRYRKGSDHHLENCIIKEGLMLCEIPKVFNDERRELHQKLQNDIVNSMEGLKHGLGLEPTMPGQVFAAQTSPGFTTGW